MIMLGVMGRRRVKCEEKGTSLRHGFEPQSRSEKCEVWRNYKMEIM